MPHVDPGELRYQVQLVVPVREKDENDHYVENDAEITVRAGVRAVKSADAAADGAARQVETLQFIIRWRSGITTDAAVIFRGQRYEIEYVDPVPWAGGYMRLKAVSYDAPVGEMEDA